MKPLIRVSVAPIEQKRADFLQRIDFAKQEDKQQRVFDGEEPCFAPATDALLPHLPLVLERIDMGVPSLCKGNKQLFAFGFVESRERAKRPRTVSKAIIREHEAPLCVVEVDFSSLTASP